MNCKTFKSLIEPYLKNGTVNVLSEDGERHLQRCTMCRDKYALLLDDHIADNTIITESPGFTTKVSIQFTPKASPNGAM
jgi:hypothetical protein